MMKKISCCLRTAILMTKHLIFHSTLSQGLQIQDSLVRLIGHAITAKSKDHFSQSKVKRTYCADCGAFQETVLWLLWYISVDCIVVTVVYFSRSVEMYCADYSIFQ